LIDTGADISIINRDYVDKLGIEIENSDTKITFANNSQSYALGKVNLKLKLNKNIDWNFLVVDRLPVMAILGSDFLEKHYVTIDYREKTFTLEGRKYSWNNNNMNRVLIAEKIQIPPLTEKMIEVRMDYPSKGP